MKVEDLSEKENERNKDENDVREDMSLSCSY